MSEFDQQTMLAAARIVMASAGGGSAPATTQAPVAVNPLEFLSEIKTLLPQLQELMPLLDLLKKKPAEKEVKAEEKPDVDVSPEEESTGEDVEATGETLVPMLLNQLGEQVAELAMQQYEAHQTFSAKFDDLDSRLNKLVEVLQMAMKPPSEEEKPAEKDCDLPMQNIPVKMDKDREHSIVMNGASA